MTDSTDRPVILGFLVDHHDTSPRTVELSWGQICTYFLTNHEESPCMVDPASPNACVGAKCPHKSRSSVPRKPMAFVPAVVEGARVDRNVRAITLLVLDYDHLAPGEAVRVERALTASGVEHAIYTTHNHRPPDDIAFRVVALLSRAVAADQWHRFLPAAVAHLGASVERIRADGKVEWQPDPVCRNRSRLYYFPSHPRGAPSDAAVVSGKPLNVDEVLARAPAFDDDPFGDFSDRAPIPDESAWSPADMRRVAEVAARSFPARRRNEFSLALAGMLRRAGADRDTARAIVLDAARFGGSDAPEDRAKTVDHTYGLDDDAPLTGFSRIQEIVGEAAARAIGGAIVDAKNNAILRDLGVDDASRASPPAPSANGIQARAVDPPTLPVEAAVDLGEVRRRLSALAARRARSIVRDDLVLAAILHRALAGDPLTRGEDDKETVFAGREGGASPAVAVERVAWSLACALPLGTPFEAVSEVLRASLVATPGSPGGWFEAARADYDRAVMSRRAREAQETAREARGRAAAIAAGPPPLLLSDGESTGGDPSPLPEDPSDDSWRDVLRKRGDGSLAPIPHNARVILEHDPVFRGALCWNDVSKRVEVRAAAGPLARYAGRLQIEAVATAAQDLLASAFDLAIPYQDVARRVVAIARSRPFDPLADYLRSIRWDGVPRAGGWLASYCGAEESDYNREVGRRWLVALVARGLRPGTKVDNVLVLEGFPGIGKSTCYEILGGEWFCDTAIELGNKDSQMLAGRYWICELAELVSIRRTGQHGLKHFFSSRVDKFRPPYAHGYEDFPRRCLFVGTTNDASYLTDETGNRKYWCVACAFVDEALARLRRDRDQILAEAVAIYRGASDCPDCLTASERCPAHRWWFSYREIHITEEEAEKRVVETPAKLKVEAWWYGMEPAERPTGFTTMDVAEAALEALPAQVQGGLLMSIGHALAKMRFERRRDPGGLRTWRYYPTDVLKSAPRQANGLKGRRGSLFALPSLAGGAK